MDDIHSQLKRFQVEWRGPGGVEHGDDIFLPGDGGDCRDILDFKGYRSR